MKIATYPLATFTKALELAKAVDDLGDNCAHTTCAMKMNKKISGGFKDIISSAVKYGLITNKKGILTLTNAYNEYKLSYTPEEANTHKEKLFLNPPLFQEVYDKYKKVRLPPSDILEKALVREFGIADKLSSRMAKYFINGAKFIGLLDEQNNFTSKAFDGKTDALSQEEGRSASDLQPQKMGLSQQNYSIQIVGPNTDVKLPLAVEADFQVVEAMLLKVRKTLKLVKEDHKKDEDPESSS